MRNFAIIGVAAIAALAGTTPGRSGPHGPAAPAADHALVATRSGLTLEGARAALDAAVAHARGSTNIGAIAVVDEAGTLLAFARLDDTFIAASTVSVGKARTAAIFRKPTRFFEETIKGGRTPMVALDDFTPLQGGVPITVDGRVVGAIGVSGAGTAPQDEEVALAGAAAVESPGH